LGIRAAAVIPLEVGGTVFGAMTFEMRQEVGPWSERLVEHLRLATQVLGDAIVGRMREEKLNIALTEAHDLETALDEHAIIDIADPQGKITSVNNGFCKLSKYSRQELLGKNHRILNSGHHPQEFFRGLWTTIVHGQVWRGEIKNRAKDGSFYWEATTIVPFLTDCGEPRKYISIRYDITERKLAEEALAKSYAEIKQLKDRLLAETQSLKIEIKLNLPHGEIIGRSEALKRVLRQVEQVAPADCAVLITGETGTGKELIARAIHRLSSRKDRMMVTVNCAALPAALVESELFGRERGAYTGALTSEVGRFEVADGSTIFLDEIGELSLETQAKLLRVLQEGEFQRLGNPKTRKVNVRVIAASNKDLTKEVRAGRFREDLYYRLRVFPINVPPLRERIEDIPLLLSAFVEEFSSRMSKQVNRVPQGVLEALKKHPWPGNIRELRNVIERGMIISSGETLRLPNLDDPSESTLEPTSLAEVEREHILRTLGEVGWRVKGPYGAAKRLEMNASTLYSRMAKLGIQRPVSRDGGPKQP
jgi:PAS domain S-box-containing protein